MTSTQWRAAISHRSEQAPCWSYCSLTVTFTDCNVLDHNTMLWDTEATVLIIAFLNCKLFHSFILYSHSPSPSSYDVLNHYLFHFSFKLFNYVFLSLVCFWIIYFLQNEYFFLLLSSFFGLLTGCTRGTGSNRFSWRNGMCSWWIYKHAYCKTSLTKPAFDHLLLHRVTGVQMGTRGNQELKVKK